MKERKKEREEKKNKKETKKKKKGENIEEKVHVYIPSVLPYVMNKHVVQLCYKLSQLLIRTYQWNEH